MIKIFDNDSDKFITRYILQRVIEIRAMLLLLCYIVDMYICCMVITQVEKGAAVYRYKKICKFVKIFYEGDNGDDKNIRQWQW